MGLRDIGKKVTRAADAATGGAFTGYVGSALGFGTGPVAGPETPAPLPVPEIPKAPNIDTAAQLAQEKIDAIRRRRGRGATILTGEEGAPLPGTFSAKLLGD